MIYVTKFRANDLNPSKGKQIEFNSGVIENFFQFTTPQANAEFKCISLENPSIIRNIKVSFTLSPARGDYKVYQNADGSMDLKDFFLDTLHLTRESNIDDYYAIRKTPADRYTLYYIPKSLIFSDFFDKISGDQMVYFDDSPDSDGSSREITGNPVQKIYYGCPGTGKSHEVKRLTSGLDNELVIRYDKDTTNIFRTTFHPDYDYASFVGCYKPIKEGEQPLDYRFIPQVFTKAYVTALQHPEDPIYLIIEEINRGNCAQIFGDLFQLLDRKEGVSEFPIIPDTDLSNYLYSLGLDGSEICLPANFNIYATMNTSDQSLFPMDSAFKRRWDMEYMPINYNQDEANFKITIGKDTYDWLEYLAYINKLIGKATDSEDKQMGEFFIRGDIDAKAFKNKVMFYLWNEVCKDLYNDRRPPQAFFFRDRNDKTFIFTDLFNADTGDKTLTEFFFYLKYGKNPTAEAPAMNAQELEDEDNDNE